MVIPEVMVGYRDYHESQSLSDIWVILQQFLDTAWENGPVHYSYGHLSVISTYNPIYRMYNPIEITTYNL